MAEPLLGHESLVAEWDPDADLYLLRAWTAGPAGTAGVRLAGGVELDIDVAWPSRLAELRIPADRGMVAQRVREVVEAMLGPQRLASLLANRTLEPRPLDGVRDIRSGRDERGVARWLQRVVLARQIGNDRRGSDLRRGVALLEAASSARGSGLGLRRTRGADARLGAERLLSALEHEPLRLDPTASRDLATVLRRAADLTDDEPHTSARLLALATDLEELPSADAGSTDDLAAAGGAFDLAMAPQAAAAAAPMEAPRRMAKVVSQQWLRVDRRSLPSVLEHATVRAQRVHTAEVEVRVVDECERAVGCWARAFDGAGTVVAMAPLQPRGRDSGALLLVAPEIIDDVIVEVTDQPGLPRATTTFEAVHRAILDGRDAASAERAGDRKEAAIHWHRSAMQWREAGDKTRANTAAELAAGGMSVRGARDRVPPPLIADRCS